MPTNEELKQRACEAIERHKGELVAVAKTVLENPETGFHETKTSKLVSEQFQRMGIPHRKGLALTGVKGEVQGGGGPGRWWSRTQGLRHR